ncbi:universal stress protein [Streptomyces sp. NRRL S-378]|uniref:universal stress protein n=1 Tax=Streptomyces sp. NRRL S-378 TaxID=1463904 RepID=UPI002D21A0D2|nr:universal stress protein [Streptomyces sp. NRRL S-378]
MAAEEADLTVVGTRGYGGFEGALPGSVSGPVARLLRRHGGDRPRERRRGRG